MPTVIHIVRASTSRAEVWRHCEICDELAAMPPHVFICDACTSVAAPAYGLRLVDGEGWSR